MYYNLVYFAQIEKTARVNDGDIENGKRKKPVPVEAGDVITYYINTANWASESGTYTIEDTIPKGLSLIFNSDSPQGIIRYNEDGTITVRWTTSMSGAQQFSFQVRVDPIAPGTKLYINRGYLTATANDSSVQVPTTKTYHKQFVPADISFTKVDKDDPDTVLSGAVFNLYKCTSTDHASNHSDHEDAGNNLCEWGPDSLIGTETSGDDGRVAFSGVDINDIYVLVETSAPEGYSLPPVPAENGNNNIIKVTLDANGAITFFSGRGKFETLATDTDEKYMVANEKEITRLRIKKEIAGFDSMSQDQQAELATHPFFITLSSGVQGSTELKHGEMTKDMVLNMTQSTMTVQISELEMMEFDTHYIVETEIKHADGTSSNLYRDQIVIKRGDDVTITVINTFEHTPYFKDWDAVTNTFTAS